MIDPSPCSGPSGEVEDTICGMVVVIVDVVSGPRRVLSVPKDE